MVEFAQPIAPVEGMGPSIPPGIYNAVIQDSKTRISRNGHEMVLVEYRIEEGPHAGAIVTQFLNMGHDNPEVVRIAREEAGRISTACGYSSPVTNSDQWHDRPVQIEVEEDGSYTRIKRVSKSPLAVKPDAELKPAPVSAAKPSAAAPPWKS